MEVGNLLDKVEQFGSDGDEPCGVGVAGSDRIRVEQEVHPFVERSLHLLLLLRS